MNELDQWFFRVTGMWPHPQSSKILKENFLKGRMLKLVSWDGVFLQSCAALIDGKWVEL